MAQIVNTFISGKMNSDLHNSMQDEKNYTHAENVRISGKGEDGAFNFVKGSKLVSTQYAERGMVVLGAYEGSNNKNYFFLAMPNGKSRIIQVDTETEDTTLIIEDLTVLRFDLVRWNKGEEIKPYKYILSINQVDNLLIFSNDVWEDIRCIDLSNIQKYANGFVLEDVLLPKKPPAKAPDSSYILKIQENKDSDLKDKFVSFCYRYKYDDGSFSTNSFYTDTSFHMGGYNDDEFKLDKDRLNVGMTNQYNAVRLIVNTGNRNVTDIQVLAKERGSNTHYIISEINKKSNNLADNSDTIGANYVKIEYNYGNTYPILTEDFSNLNFSMTPKFPKGQTSIGNRLLYANYKEGYDLTDRQGEEINVSYSIDKVFKDYQPNAKNTTLASMLTYTIGMVYFNDYNYSTTVLLNEKNEDNEIKTNFQERLKCTSLKGKINHNPPAFATKFKWVVKAETLNYENVFFTYAKRVGSKVKLLLDKSNINKLKDEDYITFIHPNYTEPIKHKIEDVKTLTNINDYVDVSGTYAIIKDPENSIITTLNPGTQGEKKNGIMRRVSHDLGMSTNRFENISINTNAGCQHGYWAGMDAVINGTIYLNNWLDELCCWGDSFLWIKANDIVKYKIIFHVYKRNSNLDSDEDVERLEFNYSAIASTNYYSVDEFIAKNHDDPKFKIDLVSGKLHIMTTEYMTDWITANRPNFHSLPNETGERINVWLAIEMNFKRGIESLTARTDNKFNETTYFFEDHKTYDIANGKHIGADANGFFDIGLYNAYAWGNGVESYKIKDEFNAKKLLNDCRPNMKESVKYSQKHRKDDLTYTELFNSEMKINNLPIFNNTKANWKSLPIQYGEIQRIISTDGDVSVFCTDKVINQLYGKSVLMDLTGNENVGISNEVLGDYRVLPYEYGISNNPESVVKFSNMIFFTDKKRNKILVKSGDDITELNAINSGYYHESIKLLRETQSLLGSFNEENSEYYIGLDHNKVLAYSLLSKGFTAQYTYKFDYILGSYGKHFSAYQGRIYQDEVTENYNSFAGQSLQEARISFVVNPKFNNDFVYKALMLQSNTPWNVEISTNLTKSDFSEMAFTEKESFYYTEIHRDNAGILNMKGIGAIQEINGNTLTFKNKIGIDVAVGDKLINENMATVGDIIDINNNTITIGNPYIGNVGDYVLAEKITDGTYTPDGVPIRGKWMTVTLTKTGDEPFYLTSVATEVIESKL